MANLYFRNTGSTAFSLASNWSLTDGGGATASAFPTAADDIFLTANSGNCTISGNPSACKSINCTGYTRTLTINSGNGIKVSGNILLVNTMTINFLGYIQIDAACTFTLAGFAINSLFLLNGANVTPSEAVTITTLTHSSGTVTWSGSFAFTATNFVIAAAGVQTILAAGMTYRTTTFTSISATGSAHSSFASSSAGTKAILRVSNVNCGYTDFTDIDASRRAIGTFNGVVSNCTNVVSMTDRPQITNANSLIA